MDLLELGISPKLCNLLSRYAIIEGDCLEVLESLVGSGQAVHIITDPPYDIQDEYRGGVITETACMFPCANHIAFCSPENQWPAEQYLFWIKPTSTKNFSRSHGRFVEMIALNPRRGSIFNTLHWSAMTGVYHDILEEKPVHPFQKPLSLMERLVLIHSDPGDIILDPFCGYATTGVAALRHGRKFVGIEKDPKWAQLGKERLDKV